MYNILKKLIFSMGETQQQSQKPDFKDVENGPLDESNRQCRDVFCCILFLINIGGMIYCTIHAYLNGDPDIIFRGIADNVVCGKTGGVAENFPYVYFYNPIYSTDNRVCVKTCPSFSGSSLSTLSCYTGHSVSCSYDVTFASDGSVSASNSAMNSNSIFLGYETTAVLGRLCMPSASVISDGLASAATSISSSLQTGSFGNLVEDIQNNWQWLLCGVGMAIVISLIFMFLLRCLVGCIVWFSCIGVILVFILAGFIFLYNGGVFAGTGASEYVGFLGLPTLSGSDYYATYGYISFGIAALLLILLLCCCSRIRLAVAVCKVAGKYVVGVCQVIVVPIFLGIVCLGLWACCLLCMVYLLSVTTFTIADSTDVFTSVASYSDTNLIMLYYFIFATLWCNAIIGAIGIFVVAASCCMWYYNHGANDELQSPIMRSFKFAFRYHFGSLAFGSFILAVVQFLQLMVQLFKKQAESSGADQTACFQYVINCLRCCLACIERIVQFLNKTAYIQIALRGKNFCGAAKDGFEIVWSNGMRYLIVAGVGEIIMFIGKLMIAAGATACFYLLITFVDTIKENVLEPIYLLVIVFLISYMIALLFMAIYNIAMDTILACFIVDQMNQEASGGKKALYAPEELYQLLPHED